MDQIKGRGSISNRAGRFEKLHVEFEDDGWGDPEEEKVSPKTEVFHDATRTIIANNDSPDVGFSASINCYRGCEHGCWKDRPPR